MRMRLKKTQAAAVVLLMLTASVAASNCGGKNVNTIVANTADYGTALAKSIKATGQAVADAETQKLISREDSVKALNVLLRITEKGEEAGKYLQLILNAQGTPASVEAAGKLQTVLEFMDSELFNVLVPIKDDKLKANIVALVTEVSKTIGVIQREVLGRIK